MHRRNLITGLGAGLLAGVYNTPAFANPFKEKPAKTRVLRIAHITDVHLEHSKGAPDGFIKCLHHIQSLSVKPDFIFNGGDTIDDALAQTKAHVKKQWELFHSITQNECCIPIEHCIGNHDVWGLLTEKYDPLYGKNFALEQMQLDKPYRSFDKNGWHFIILDSTHERKSGIWYTARLGNEQTDWLQNDLQITPATTPVMIISHIPIISASVFFDKAKVNNGNIKMPASLMHADYKRMISIFNKYPNIRLCISGHTHLHDQVVYNNIAYFCNGAVSGNWWKTDHCQETKAGYAIIDLYDDGSFTNIYTDYTYPETMPMLFTKK
jgi:predicted MPP superfamily phosphohydrolase